MSGVNVITVGYRHLSYLEDGLDVEFSHNITYLCNLFLGDIVESMLGEPEDGRDSPMDIEAATEDVD